MFLLCYTRRDSTFETNFVIFKNICYIHMDYTLDPVAEFLEHVNHVGNLVHPDLETFRIKIVQLINRVTANVNLGTSNKFCAYYQTQAGLLKNLQLFIVVGKFESVFVDRFIIDRLQHMVRYVDRYKNHPN